MNQDKRTVDPPVTRVLSTSDFSVNTCAVLVPGLRAPDGEGPRPLYGLPHLHTWVPVGVLGPVPYRCRAQLQLSSGGVRSYIWKKK